MTENQKRRFEDRIPANPLDWNDAQAEKSSTAGAAKGGNTSAKSIESGTAPTVEVDEDIRIARHAVFNLKEFRAGRTTFPGEALGILERCFDRLASKPPAREADQQPAKGDA